MIWMSGECAFIARATPVRVPPVPAVMTTASTLPPHCARISAPVPSSWASGFDRLAYWSRMWLLGIASRSRLATPMWLSGASHAASVGVRMISAPSASRTTCFSCDIFSGIVMITR